MSVQERVAARPIASEHIVQFFDTDESRAECVAAFVAEGYRAGEPAIIVARPTNWEAIAAELEASGVPVERAIAAGMIVVKDASATLRRLSRNGSPDPDAFESVVGKAVDGLAKGRTRIRAYGEMVDMLAQSGELPDALRLEDLWNKLGERVPFCLLCGYSAAHFVSPATHRALREICTAHSSVHHHPQDPLATWLLSAAHDPGTAATTQ